MKILRKIATVVAGLALGLSVMAAPVVVTEPVSAISCPSNCVETSILGDKYDASGNKVTDKNYTGETISCSCDDGQGSSVKNVLSLVVNIMTIGIGILGVIGIVIVGIQYITAADNEEQTRKAKRRLTEIVIGLFVYVIAYAALYWLVPGFEPFKWSI